MKADVKERIDMINRGQVPEGYKKTREGIIPYEWKIEKLGKYVTIHSGESPSKFKFCSTGVSYYKVDDLNNCDKYLANSELKIDEKDLKKVVPKNSLIFPKRGASILTNKVRILKENSFFDTNLMGIEPNEEKINYEFLYYLILEKGLYKIADTSTIPQLNNKHIEPLLVVLPNVSEQKRIAQVLSTWDKAIELKEKLIEQKKEQKKGLMQRLLTGKVRLPGFEGKWEKVKLGDIIKECKEQTTKNNEYPVLTSSRKGLFLQEDYFSKQVASVDNTGYKIVRKGDFTYRTMSDDGNFVFNQLENYEIGIVSPAYAVFRPTKVNSIFLRHLLNSYNFKKYIKKIVQGGTRLSLRFNDLKEIRVIIPSLEEQNAIGDVLRKAEEQIALMEQELFELKQQKKGLMQLLLTGKVRVKC